MTDTAGTNGFWTQYANPSTAYGSEASMLAAPRVWLNRQGAPVVFGFHGLLGSALVSWGDPAVSHDDFQAIVKHAGQAFVGSDFGGFASWGNPNSVQSTRKMVEYISINNRDDQPTYPYRASDISKIVAYGQSMGAAVACNWAIRNFDKCAGLALLVPAVDLVGLRDNTGLSGSIDGAYGGAAAFDAAAPRWSPYEYVDELVAMYGDRIAVWYSSDDEVIPIDYVRPFVEKVRRGGGYTEDIGGIHASALTDPGFPLKLGAWLVKAESRTPLTTNVYGIREEYRWYQLIRNASTPVSSSWFRYLGGDVTDSEVMPSGERVWIGADWFAGATISSLDNFNSSVLPFRTGLLVESADGAFTRQVYASGNSGNWINHDAGLYPTATNYWPICCAMEGNVLQVGCWLVGAGGPYGNLLDSHIVSINASTYAITGTPVPFGDDSGQFWIESIMPDPDGYTYVYFEEFSPPYDADINNDGSVPNYGKGDLQKSVTYRRVARVPTGDLTDFSSYRWWDGGGWAMTKGQAVRLRDVDGQLIGGDGAVAKTPIGNYLLVAHQLVANHIKAYTGPTPAGPWTLRHNVPTLDMGGQMSGGVRIGQLTKILPQMDSSPGTYLTITSMNNLNTVDAWTERHISTYSPRFVEVPYA